MSKSRNSLWFRYLKLLLVLLFLWFIPGGITNAKVYDNTYKGTENLIKPLPQIQNCSTYQNDPEGWRKLFESIIPSGDAHTTKTSIAGWPIKQTVVTQQPVAFYCGDTINKRYDPKPDSYLFSNTWQFQINNLFWTLPYALLVLIFWRIYENNRH